MEKKVKTGRILPAVTAAIVVLLAVQTGPKVLAQSEAVAFQINAAHSGACIEPNIVFPLSEKWSVSLPGSVSYPVIANGRVFVTVEDTSVDEVKLYALNETDGSIAWGPLAIGTQWSTANATYDRGTLFVDDSGIIQAFDAANGQLKWTIPLPLQYSFTGPPTASGGTLYATGGGEGGTAYALDETDGRLLWDIGTTTEPGLAVGSDGIYLSPSGKEAYDLNPITGAVIWHDSPDYDGEGSIGAFFKGDFFIREPFVFSPPDGVELNAETGAQVGSFNAGPAPAFYAEMAFFLNNNTLSGNSIKTQTEAWSVAGSSVDPFVSAPIVAGGAVIEGTASGALEAFDTMTGKLVWTGSAGAKLSAPQEFGLNQPLTGLAAASGLVVVPAADTLAAFGSASADVSNEVSVSVSSLKQSSGVWQGTITIKNTSLNRLLGPFDAVLTGLSGANLVNDAGALNGQPYVFDAIDTLAPGGSIALRVQFDAPNPTFSVATYSGVL